MGEVYFFDHSPGILKTFWTKNGEKIDIEESNGKLSETRFDNPSLTITNVGPDDAGEYKVTAINAVGSTTSEVIVLGILVIYKMMSCASAGINTLHDIMLDIDQYCFHFRIYRIYNFREDIIFVFFAISFNRK